MTGPTSTEGRRNQREYARQVLSEIDNKFRNQQYLESKSKEQLRNKKLREVFEKLFNEEFAGDKNVCEKAIKHFDDWKSYQHKRSFSLAVQSLKRELSVFSDEILERFDNVVKRTYQVVEAEEKKIKKQREREEFKKLFMQAKAAK